jgi:hypothetical protein
LIKLDQLIKIHLMDFHMKTYLKIISNKIIIKDMEAQKDIKIWEDFNKFFKIFSLIHLVT